MAICTLSKKHGVRTLLSGFGGDMTASFNGKGYMAQLARTGHWFELALLRQDKAIAGQFYNTFWTSYGEGIKYTNGNIIEQ